jgi:hypothetical protein
VERLVSDAVACGVGPLAGLDEEETYEALSHINTLPRHRHGQQQHTSPGGLLYLFKHVQKSACIVLHRTSFSQKGKNH